MCRRLVTAVAMLVGLAACGGGSSSTPTSPLSPSTPTTPTTPITATLAGSWAGSIRDPVSGDGTMVLTLVASSLMPNSLEGAWSMTFRNGEVVGGVAVAGLFTPGGYGVMLYLHEPLPPCLTGTGISGSAAVSYTLLEVVVTSNRLTAVAGRLSCAGSIGFGTVSLTKQ